MIDFETKRDRELAIELLDGTELNGRRITLQAQVSSDSIFYVFYWISVDIFGNFCLISISEPS